MKLLFVAYSILLGCYVLWPSHQLFVVLCGLCSWKNIYGGQGWHSILKFNYCTACANIVHTSKLRMYKPDELVFSEYPAMYSACPAVDNIPNQPIFVVNRLDMYRTKVLLYRTMVLMARLTKVRC